MIGALAGILSNPLIMGLLGRSDFYQGIGNWFRGFRRPAIGQAPAAPGGGRGLPTVAGGGIGEFGGRQTVGTPPGGFGPSRYGHTIGESGTPRFEIPGAGGGSVAIPELASAARGGDPWAKDVIARQGESAQRMSMIDALIEALFGGGKPGAPAGDAPVVAPGPFDALTPF